MVMTEAHYNRDIKLHRTAMVIGIAGVIAFVFFLMSLGEEPFGITAIIGSLFIYGLPLLCFMFVAWIWSRVGGIILIVIALPWAISRLAIMQPTNTPGFLLLFVAILTLPMLASGTLFFLSVIRNS